MEILGTRIPSLQNAIASGLESVTAGIAESTKASGVAALSVAQDSFSFEQTGTSNTANLPAVSEAAEYPAPDQYFRQFPGTASDSPVSSLAISKTLSDPEFNAAKSLETFGQAAQEVNKIVADAPRPDHVNKIVADGGKNTDNGPGSMSPGNFTDDMGKPDLLGDILGSHENKRVISPSLNNPLNRYQSDAATVDTSGGYPAGDRFGRDKIEGFKVGEAQMDKPTPSAIGKRRDEIGPGEAQMWKPAPGEALMWKPTSGDMTSHAADRFGNEKFDGRFSHYGPLGRESFKEMERFQEEVEKKQAKDREMVNADLASLSDDVSYPATDRFGRDTVQGASVEGKTTSGSSDAASDRSIIVVGGKNDAASDRSIIVVGGKSDASDRSIIVVGGKTPDIYLQTIDDSMNQLRQNPTAQAAELFRNQVGAVQNLLTTVDQVVQLQKTFSSNVFERSFRI